MRAVDDILLFREPLWRDFVRDWEQFLDLTSLIVIAPHLGGELCLIYRVTFCYRGAIDEWAEIQSTWASRRGFRGKNWSKKDFVSSRFDDGLTSAVTRFLGILQKYRHP